MTVESVGSTSGLYATATASTAKQQFDSDMFMQLFVAQLKNQDPTSPMDTNQMLTQQSQLTSLELMTDMSSTSQEQFALAMRMAALGMVGKEVSYYDAEGEVVSGTASGASFEKSVPTIAVGDKKVALDAILSITSAE